MIRTDREDLSDQTGHLAASKDELLTALAVLQGAAKDAQRGSGGKRWQPQLGTVHAAFLAVQRAEEAVDLAALDLHTAAGGDA